MSTAKVEAKVEETKAGEITLNIKNLASVAAPYSRTGLKISTKITMVKKTEVLQSVCSYTGIVMELTVPSIEGIVLEHTSPFSDYGNVAGIIKQGENYLNKLELQILAGLWLTAYRNFDLVSLGHKHNSSLVNAMLRTAGKEVLINSLLLTQHLTQRIAGNCPKLFLDYNTYADRANMMATVQEYTKLLRNVIWPEMQTAADKIDLLPSEAHIAAFSITKKIHKVGKSDEQKATEDELTTYKRRAKELLAEIEENMYLPTAFITLLRTATKGSYLGGLDEGMRSKIVEKLKGYPYKECEALAEIVKKARNPFDEVFGKVSEALAEPKAVEKAAQNVNRKRSLAEILAEKQAALANKTAEGKDASDYSQAANSKQDSNNDTSDNCKEKKPLDGELTWRADDNGEDF